MIRTALCTWPNGETRHVQVWWESWDRKTFHIRWVENRWGLPPFVFKETVPKEWLSEEITHSHRELSRCY